MEQRRGRYCRSGLLPWEPLSTASLAFQAALLCLGGKTAACTQAGGLGKCRVVKSKLLQFSATSGARTTPPEERPSSNMLRSDSQ